MAPVQIDHIVILVSTSFFDDPPSWITDNFTVTPGGKHTGQASRNKLIIFADGTYLELFNWYDAPPPLDDSRLPMRVWGSKQDGLIDFALTSTSATAEECIGTINKKLSLTPSTNADLGVKYGTQVAGGRTRADGVHVKWNVTRPIFAAKKNVSDEGVLAGARVDTPFFCHDVTDRALRVASEDQSKTTHPCGATGIAEVEVLVPLDGLEEYRTLWSKIVSSEPEEEEGKSSGKSVVFDVGVPRGDGRSKIVVRGAQSEKELRRIKERGIGISDIVIAVDSVEKSKRTHFGSEGIESTIWLEGSD